MKKTLLALGVLLAVAIACQVNEPDTILETPETATEPVTVDLNPTFTVVEQPPIFPGGKDAWKLFLNEHLVVPEGDPQGKVFASFVVDKEGALHDIQLVRGIGHGADEAVVELLKKSPYWETGKQNGKKVNVRMSVAIQFGEAEKDLQPTINLSIQKSEVSNADFDQVFTVVEEMPTFPGGNSAWKTFLKDNLESPKSGVKGKVYVQFIVDKTGAIQNIKLTQGIGIEADQAVVALLKKSPKWLAGKQRGVTVNTSIQVVVDFT